MFYGFDRKGLGRNCLGLGCSTLVVDRVPGHSQPERLQATLHNICFKHPINHGYVHNWFDIVALPMQIYTTCPHIYTRCAWYNTMFYGFDRKGLGRNGLGLGCSTLVVDKVPGHSQPERLQAILHNVCFKHPINHGYAQTSVIEG